MPITTKTHKLHRISTIRTAKYRSCLPFNGAEAAFTGVYFDLKTRWLVGQLLFLIDQKPANNNRRVGQTSVKTIHSQFLRNKKVLRKKNFRFIKYCGFFSKILKYIPDSVFQRCVHGLHNGRQNTSAAAELTEFRKITF